MREPCCEAEYNGEACTCQAPRCSDCGRLARFGADEQWHHETTPDVGCFLIPPENPDGSFVEGEWRSIPSR
jgi:hypothetical protein